MAGVSGMGQALIVSIATSPEMTHSAFARGKQPTSAANPPGESTSGTDPLTVLLNPTLLQPAPNLAPVAGSTSLSARLGAAQCISDILTWRFGCLSPIELNQR